jgi:hypothetical protein
MKGPAMQNRETPATESHDETFETTDFHLAAFLRCKGWRLVRLGRNGRRAVFVFADRAEREATVISFYNDAVIPARRYAESIREVKALIHNAA